MSRFVKFLIGLAAALVIGLLNHGPLGRGQGFIDTLDARAQVFVAYAAVPGVTLQMQRDPLTRTAILAGPANRFQREGQGSLPGLDERVLSVPGIARIEWANPPPR